MVSREYVFCVVASLCARPKCIHRPLSRFDHEQKWLHIAVHKPDLALEKRADSDSRPRDAVPLSFFTHLNKAARKE